MTGFDAFSLFLSIKLHFTKDDYDFFTYNGRVTASQKSYETRRDRMFFDKLAKHPDPKGFLVSAFILDPKSEIRKMAYSPLYEKNWELWSKRVQSLTYHVKEELTRLGNITFTSGNNEHTPIFKAFLGGKISLETLTVVTKSCDTVLGMVDDPITMKYNRLIRKYNPFLQYDPVKILKLVMDGNDGL